MASPTVTPAAAPAKKKSPISGIAVIAIGGFLIWLFFLRSPSSPTAPGAGAPVAPDATARPTAAAISFADITLSGRGDSVERFTIPEGAAAIAVLSHRGQSNFIVETLADSGTANDLLVNTIGTYSGTRLFDVGLGEHSVGFEIQADGSWMIIIQPPTKARAWAGTGTLSGSGDDVVRVSPSVSGLTTARLTHTGESNFIIESYSSAGVDLVANEIGRYNGQVTLASGTFLLEVQADGAWSVVAE